MARLMHNAKPNHVLQHNPNHVFSEVSFVEYNGAYSQVRGVQIAGLVWGSTAAAGPGKFTLCHGLAEH